MCQRHLCPEVVGDTGLFFQPSDSGWLVDALDRLVEDAGLRAALIGKGLDRTRMFSWDRAVAETYATYRKVL